MRRTSVAFCPGHISGYFMPITTKDIATTGGAGAGIVINEGVLAQAELAENPGVIIYHRNRDGEIDVRLTGSRTIEYVMKKLRACARITTECNLPMGAGFGLSAAALLASITALDDLLHLHLGREKIAALAHESEIVHHSGLGDVAACMGGGMECRREAGISAEVIRWHEISEPIFAVTLAPLSTESVLSSPEVMNVVSAAFPDRCPRDFSDFFKLSRSFAERIGLISDDVRSVLDACDDSRVQASMTMLGNGVFACGAGAEEVLKRFGSVYRLRAAEQGVNMVRGGADE